MNLIVDTGPVIALAKIKQLQLLKDLSDYVFIAEAVYKELMAKTGSEVKEIDVALKQYITVVTDTQNHATKDMDRNLRHLGPGEKESILISYLHQDDSILVLDDKVARQAARKLSITFTGTVGIIIQAKNEGLIDSATEALIEMRNHGYWLSSTIIEETRKVTGE